RHRNRRYVSAHAVRRWPIDARSRAGWGWAAPGSAAPQPAATTAPPAGGSAPRSPRWTPRSTAARRPTADTGPALPVPLRPLTIGDILDGAVEIVKLAPRTVVVLTAVVVLPIQVALAIVTNTGVQNPNAIGVLGSPVFIGQVGSDRTNAAVVLFGLSSLVLPVLTGAIAWLVASWYGGSSPALGDVTRTVARRVPALLAAWVLVHLVEAVALLACGVPALFAMTFFLVVAPAVVVEGIGPIAGMRRSFRLTRRQFFTAVGVCVLSAFVENAVFLAFTGLGAVTGDLSWGWIVAATLTAVGTLVSKPIVAGATALAYLDLRIRSEGLDLELAARQHLGAHG
ncbi:MAG: hypothetical protein ACRD29_10235, partial [Acidimicrobiales bacterium]